MEDKFLLEIFLRSGGGYMGAHEIADALERVAERLRVASQAGVIQDEAGERVGSYRWSYDD